MLNLSRCREYVFLTGSMVKEERTRTGRRSPAHSIVASEGWRLWLSPRSSPVSILSHPLPPSATGTARSVTQGGKRVRLPARIFTMKTLSVTAIWGRVVSDQAKLLFWREQSVCPVLFWTLYSS